MGTHRTALAGRRGWSAVVGLSTVLTVLVAGQLPAAAEDRPLAPVATALSVLVPSLASAEPVDEAEPTPVATAATAATAGPAALPAAAEPAADPAGEPTAAPTAGAAARPVATSAADRVPGRPATPLAPPPVAGAVQAAAPAAAAVPAAAPADLCAGDGWQERRGQAALAALRGGAERTGFRVEFAPARSGYMGLAHLQERRIEVFVRPCGSQSDELLRHVMAHELGHAYDTTRMDDALRVQWKAARGIPASTDWYGCSGCTDFATPAGDFAEVYAQWARGATSNRSELAGDAPAAELASLAGRFFTA